MGTKYYPDRWVLIEINSAKYGRITKVLASWYGGFAGSDAWKLSSGITKVIKNANGYEFENCSGSTYYCGMHGYGMSGYTSSIYNDLEKQLDSQNDGSSIKIFDETVNFENDVFCIV